jgi:hypothetical protein
VRDSAAIDLGNPALPLDPEGTRADAGAFSYDPSTCAAPSSFCAGKSGGSLCLALTPVGAPPGGLAFELTGAVAGTFVAVVAAAKPSGGKPAGQCLSSATRPLFVAQSDQAGNARVTLDEAALAALGHPVGALRYIQAWQRDPSEPSGCTTSAAFEWRHCR